MTDMRLTAEFSRKAAAQGTVLLKNDGQVLPFQKGECIAVFGRSQIDTYRSGTGSGGLVNAPYAVNLTAGLQNSGMVTVESGMFKLYQKWILENPFDNEGGKWAGQPWAQKEMCLNDKDVENSCKYAGKALVIFGRTAGEDKDNRYERGSYLLSPDEEAMLCKVAKHFERIVVLLNTGNVIDMGWMDLAECRDRIKAVVMMYQGGQESGNAIADVLTGKVTPSGKRTDTIARHIND